MSGSRAEIIAIGYSSPIRSIQKEIARAEIDKILKICGISYLSIKQDSNNAIAIGEATNFIISKFAMIGINEIQEAFSMAAANYFDGIELKAYFGAFSISLLGDVLSAYLNYRNGILAEMLKASEMAEKEAKKLIEAEEKNEQARKIAIEQIKEAIKISKSGSSKWENVNQIPANYSDIAIKNGLINPTDKQKLKIWHEAQSEAKKEFIDIAMNPADIKQAREAKAILAKLSSGEQDIKFVDAAKRIYSKLLIWEFVKPDKNKTV